MTLYLKYRPQKLEELDLVSVKTQLKNIIDSGNIPHAFLFCGTKGTGKTSAARILAKVLNCEKQSPKAPFNEPCNECQQCKSITNGSNIDVIEMDAASNRGIDDVRTLRETVKLASAAANKKIYIIDEAHMLTTEASNALLKTLEEPPSHVVFVLATTNPEKLPATIQSRLTVVNFTQANEKEITQKLVHIAKQEKFKVEDEAYMLISKASEGSFRDAVKILESLSLQSKVITSQNVRQYLFGEAQGVDQLVEYLNKKDLQNALGEIERASSSGASVKLIIDELLNLLHINLLFHNGIGESKILKLSLGDTQKLITLLQAAKSEQLHSPIAQLPLEMALVSWLNYEVKKTEIAIKPVVPSVEEKQEIKEDIKVTVIPGDTIDTQVWSKVLTNMRGKNASIEALLRAAEPLGYDGKTLTLGVYYKFHKERLEVGPNRKTLETVLEQAFGKPVIVNCTLSQKPVQSVKNQVVLTEAPVNDIMKAAKEIFGQ